MTYKTLLTFAFGLFLGGSLTYFYVSAQTTSDYLDYYQANDAYHVHGDFAIILEGEQMDLTLDEYQSTAESIKHTDVHLHDNQGDIIHHHEEDVAFATFMNSIGLTFNNNCLTLATGEEYCTNDEQVLRLYVNGEVHPDPSTYVLSDEDQILLYYGDPDSPEITNYLEQVDDRACIYSGTCPERGTAPPEECGLTCEL